MTKARLLAFPLTLALAFGGATAVMAQDESPAADDEMSVAFDPCTVIVSACEANMQEALIIYIWMRQQLLDSGIPEGDVGAAADWLESEVQNMSEEDAEELFEGSFIAEMMAE